MIFRRILPLEGGAIRRMIRIRKTLFENSLKFESQQQSQQLAAELKPLQPMKPLNLIDFTNKDDIADAEAASIGNKNQNWRISDDEVIGGFSRASFTLMHATTHATTHGITDTDNQQPHNQPPFVKWEGNISTKIGPKSRAKRSGFCAIRCPEFLYALPVGNKYNALEIQCRTDERHYTVNLKVQSFFPDDLYQSLITVKHQDVVETMKQGKTRKEITYDEMSFRSNMSSNHANSDDNSDHDDANSDDNHDDNHDDANSDANSDDNHHVPPFVSVILPFRDFVLTSHGMMKAQQRCLDGGLQLQHLGFTLMDGKDGPFRFDLRKIRLVNYDSREGIVMNDDDDDDDDDGTSTAVSQE